MSIPPTLAPVRVGSVGLKPTKKVPLKASPETVTGRFPFLLPGREWYAAVGWSTLTPLGRRLGTTLEQDMCVFVGGGGAELSDVKLVVGSTSRPAHRSILAARAAYFEAMFRSFSPPDDIVNIKICDTVPSEEAFDSLMRYIYYGDTNMPTEDSLYLFQAPIYYGFTNNRLQVFCKHNLQSNVTCENVLAILQAADRMRAIDIKEYALKMIVHHFPVVARQESIKNLPQPLLVDILQALAEEPRCDVPLMLQPRSLPTSASADTLTDDIDYRIQHKQGKC
ncbi:Leucine-zipper-like transcriptional regulator 1 [Eumeta japonica]|uniref:Leucine-zipper-like transcriptional regulator 1 n=1 Tax=Eumeta variegata TaxID=151549 RepID=A0A4C1SHF9_EUMVA|nr:Leucine-zipper-like transcriptional regulator 1 [Eumeta japonica]